ncbi:MAG: DUF58 domain-containing protein [Sterolibacterium sp.]|nr:DUF58 domain-containing protein [Sterolibacterium sp.]
MSLKTRLQAGFHRWALRGKSPENAPILLAQHRIYVLPSGQGLAFAGMLALMLAATMNYALSLGYLLVFLLAGLGVMTIIHTFRNLAQLRIQPGRCLPVFAGETAHFGLLLENQRDTPRPAIQLHLPDQPAICVDLPAHSRTEVRLSLPTQRRGWLAMPRVTLATTYPLGLIRTWAYAVPAASCLVYPAPARRAPAVPCATGETGQNVPLGEGREDFSGLRTYQPADPLRHIAWKTAARQPEAPLQTKQFSGMTAQDLWFDWQDLPATLDVEQRLAVLARWICDAHGNDLRWGLRLPGSLLAPAQGAAHFHACLKALALYGTH